MAPRCFEQSQGPHADRLGFLRRIGVFYSLLAIVLVLFEARSFVVTRSMARVTLLAAFTATVLGTALRVPSVHSALSGAAYTFQTRVIDPLHAEEYLRWGVQFARAGKLDKARHELARAAELSPADSRARNWQHVLERPKHHQL